VTNPQIVVEVLPPDSPEVELGSKARTYTRVPSLTDLLMIDQKGIGVEHWVRRAGGHWDVALVADREGVIKLEALGCEIPVAEIYGMCDEV